MAQKLDYIILDLLESTARNIKAHPLNLGGVTGGGGGVGGPPGGFIGWLPQTRVAYDQDEFATLYTPASGMSLLDNLNHIRYRLGTVEASGVAGTIRVFDNNTPATYNLTDTIHFSGAGVIVTNLGSGDIRVTISGGGGGSPLVVQEADGSPIVSNVDKIIFSGMTVVDQGAGDAFVYPLASYYDSRYLKLDASNDPVVGGLLTILNTNPAQVGGVYVENINAQVLELQQNVDNAGTNSATLFMGRHANGTGNITAPFLDMRQDAPGAGIITGDWLNFSDYQGSPVTAFKVTLSGSVDIALNEYYKINGTPHTHNYIDLSGWIIDTNTWSYSSADAPTYIISVNADMTSKIQSGMRIKLTHSATVKYFIVTAVGSYSGGVTLITVYGGTDYTLSNSAFSSPHYSSVKVPFGFNSSPSKWTVEVVNSNDCTKTSPTASTWYGGTGLSSTGPSIDIPIGIWRVRYKALTNDNFSTAAVGAIGLRATLSTTDNSQSDAEFTVSATWTVPIAGAGVARFTATNEKVLTLSSKTTQYLNVFAGATTAGDVIGFLGSTAAPTIIQAICAYL